MRDEQVHKLGRNFRPIFGILTIFALGAIAATVGFLTGQRLVGTVLIVFLVFTTAGRAISFRSGDPRIRQIMAHLTDEERKHLAEMMRPLTFLVTCCLMALGLIGVGPTVLFLEFFVFQGTTMNSVQWQVAILCIMTCGTAVGVLIALRISKPFRKRATEFLFQTEFARNNGYLP